MRSHLHADAGRSSSSDGIPDSVLDGKFPQVKLRPPWLVFLAKHFAPRNHERYLLQGVELSEETLARIRAMPRKRPWWLAFLYRHFPLRDR
jgi:hypothetical protein